MSLPVIVAGRPSSKGLSIWVLCTGSDAPALSVVPQPASITSRSLRTTNDGLSGFGLFLFAITGLQPDQVHQCRFRWQNGTERTITTRTLPAGLAPNQPFTIALGSCYSIAHDAGVIARGYPPPPHRGDIDPVRIRFLLGDQIYMDLGPEKDRSTPINVAPMPADRYRAQWSDPLFQPFIEASPSVCLADDHEYWNNYPMKPGWLAWAEQGPGGPLGRALAGMFDAFQVALNASAEQIADSSITLANLYQASRSFRFDVEPLSFFGLDTRTARSLSGIANRHFARRADLDQAVQWMREAGGPGVLALGPVFTANRGELAAVADASLADYAEDYDHFARGLRDARRDILILCGDIHWSHLLAVHLANKPTTPAGKRTQLFQLASSALARIPPPPAPIGWFQGDPAVGPDNGELDDQRGQWNMQTALDDFGLPARFGTVERQSFATVTFRLASASATKITAHIVVWGLASTSSGARQVLRQTLSLERKL